MKLLKIESIADTVGIISSTICVAHCILAPGLLIGGSVAPTLFMSEDLFHAAVLWFVLPSAMFAFAIGCQKLKDRIVYILGSIGEAGLIGSALYFHELLGETGERIATLISAGLLIAAHVRNFRACRNGSCEHDQG